MIDRKLDVEGVDCIDDMMKTIHVLSFTGMDWGKEEVQGTNR